MNIQQLRIIRETVRQGFNLTGVAEALHTSQSGVSKHIKDLEDELGVELFQRKGKRLLGLTPPGEELIAIVERILLDMGNVKRLGQQFASRDQGTLTIATTHTQARYALPPAVTSFRGEFPKVNLVLHEAGPGEIVDMLLEGKADIGIATEALGKVGDLVSFPYYTWHHGVIVRTGHPLEDATPLTLQAIAQYPLVTYHQGFTGRGRIDEAFAAAELEPEITMAALDADVIKAYVELGLGVGIIASMAFDAARDPGLSLLKAEHLFAKNVSRIAVRRGSLLRTFARRFITICAPAQTEAKISAALAAPLDL